MAIVYIKDIQTRLDRTISYIGNKEKTLNENYEEIFLDLHNALDYTTDDLKTEENVYVIRKEDRENYDLEDCKVTEFEKYVVIE